MRRSKLTALTGLSLALLAAEAGAEPPRVDVEVPLACGESARALQSRLESALGRESPEGLEASVTIEQSGTGYRVVLRTRAGATALGEKMLLAANCAEAMDAAVVVLALAFSEANDERDENAATPTTAETEPSARPSISADHEAPTFVVVPPTSTATPQRDDRRRERDSRRAHDSGSSRIFVGAGADTGTLTAPTAFFAGGYARDLSALELQGVVRYGLPTSNESMETERVETVQSDFGALELRACRGTGARIRLTACAGSEVGWVRTSRKLTDGGIDVDEDAVTPRVSGVLSAVLTHRAGPVAPELELSGAGVALGREDGASWLSLRVAAGAALTF